MSRIVKSSHATVTGQRTIQTVRVVVPPAAGPLPDGQLPEHQPSPAEIAEQARLQADRMLQDARQQAASLLEEAKRQADSLVQDARQQAQQIAEEARRSGYESGFAEGKAAGEAAYRDRIEQALQLLRQLEAERKAYALQAERQLLELACAVAKKIIGRELETDSSWVRHTLQSALSELVDRSRVEVHAHPEDIPFLLSVKEDLATGPTSPVELEFVSDPSVEKGGCILRTRQGSVDARIDTQLNEVKRALLEAAAALHRE